MLENPIQYLHDFVKWCHMRKEEFWEVVKLSKEQLLRTNDPQYDDGIPSDVSAQPYVVNYKNRRHIYVYNPAVYPVVMSDNSGEWSTTLLPQTWNNVDFPNGTRLKAVNPIPGSAVSIKVLCTDEPLQSTPIMGYLKTVINANGTKLVKIGPGFLHVLVSGTIGSAWVLTFYDSTTASGTPFSIQNMTATDQGILYDVNFTNGLTVVASGTTAGNATLSWY